MIQIEFLKKAQLNMSLRPSWCPVSHKDGLGGGGTIFSSHLFNNLNLKKMSK